MIWKLVDQWNNGRYILPFRFARRRTFAAGFSLWAARRILGAREAFRALFGSFSVERDRWSQVAIWDPPAWLQGLEKRWNAWYEKRSARPRAPGAELEFWFDRREYNPGLGVVTEKWSDVRKIMRKKHLVPLRDSVQFLDGKLVSGKEFLRAAKATMEEKRGSRLPDDRIELTR